MSTYLYLFAHADDPAELTADLRRILDVTLRPVDRPHVDLAGQAGHLVVEIEHRHDFGTPGDEDPHLPLSEYPTSIVFRLLDSAGSWRDAETLARRTYEELRATGRYRLLLSYDLQDVLAASPPLDPEG